MTRRIRATTLRETIVSIIDNADGADPLWMFDAADDIIAAIRSHMTSPEAVERAIDTYQDKWDWKPEVMRAAILAALGEEL